jgi:hypothetical protein
MQMQMLWHGGDFNAVPVLTGQLYSTAHCSRVSKAGCGGDVAWIWS